MSLLGTITGTILLLPCFFSPHPDEVDTINYYPHFASEKIETWSSKLGNLSRAKPLVIDRTETQTSTIASQTLAVDHALFGFPIICQ